MNIWINVKYLVFEFFGIVIWESCLNCIVIKREISDKSCVYFWLVSICSIVIVIWFKGGVDFL